MNLKRILVPVLITAQLFAALPTYAQPTLVASSSPSVIVMPEPPKPQVGEPDVGAAISPMKKGQIAPFTGILLSPRATATIVAQLNSIQEQVKIEIDHARAEEKVKCDFKVNEIKTILEADNKIIKVQLDEREKRINILNEQIKKEEASRSNTPLWVGLSGGLGFIVGIGLTALTIFAVSQASK